MQQVTTHLLYGLIGALLGLILIGAWYMEFGDRLQQRKGERLTGVSCLLLLVLFCCWLFVRGG